MSCLRVTSVLDPQTLPPAEEGLKSPTLLSTHLGFSLQGLKDHWQTHFLIFPFSSPNHQVLYSSLRKQQRSKREKAERRQAPKEGTEAISAGPGAPPLTGLAH